jgi:hypothetical protein
MEGGVDVVKQAISWEGLVISVAISFTPKTILT